MNGPIKPEIKRTYKKTKQKEIAPALAQCGKYIETLINVFFSQGVVHYFLHFIMLKMNTNDFQFSLKISIVVISQTLHLSSFRGENMKLKLLLLFTFSTLVFSGCSHFSHSGGCNCGKMEKKKDCASGECPLDKKCDDCKKSEDKPSK